MRLEKNHPAMVAGSRWAVKRRKINDLRMLTSAVGDAVYLAAAKH
jgi:hypothetical protein